MLRNIQRAIELIERAGVVTCTNVYAPQVLQVTPVLYET
jgi:hypothetical protein